MERSVQCIKGGFSFAVRKHRGRGVASWFHEHRIRDTEDFRNQIEYVAANPGRRRMIDYPFVHTNYAGLDAGCHGAEMRCTSGAKALTRLCLMSGLKP